MANFPQLTEEDYQQFDHALNDLLEKTEASVVLIVEKAGHLIHQRGEHAQLDTVQLATLASNAFNATQFMASLIDETNFTGMYQQGEKASTLMLNVDEHCLLLIIFKAQLSVGMVKYYASNTIKQVTDQLQVAHQRAPGVVFDLTDLNITDAPAFFRKKQP